MRCGWLRCWPGPAPWSAAATVLPTARAAGDRGRATKGEGDNTGEATDLALYLNRWKKLFPVAAGKNPPLDYPVSWKHLFGNPVPASIY